MNFTRTDLNNLIPSDKIKRQTIKGTSIMVERRKDGMTFYFKYKSTHTNTLRFKKIAFHLYGSLSTADVKNIKNSATLHAGRVALGVDIIYEENQAKKALSSEKNYSELWELYKKNSNYRSRSKNTQKSYTNAYHKIRNHFKNKNVDSITRNDIDKFINTIDGGSERLVIIVLNFLEKEHIKLKISDDTSQMYFSPRTFELKATHKAKVGDIISDDLIRTIFSKSSTYSDIAKLQICHGARISEVLKIKIEHISIENGAGMLEIPPENQKTADSVNGESSFIPLTTMALGVIQSNIGNRKDGFLFTYMKI